MKLSIQVQALDSDVVQQFELPLTGQPVLLGRGPESPVPLDGVKLSRNHLALSVEGNQLTLTDLSSNGVWVNAHSIPKKSPVPLQGNEEIAIPGYRLRVRLLQPALAPAPASPAPASPAPASPAPVRATATEAMPAAAPSGSPSGSPSAPTSSRSSDTIADQDAPPLESDADAITEGPWWRLSGVERTLLVLVLLSVALFAYYANMQ